LLMLGKARGSVRDFKNKEYFNFGNATKPGKRR